MLSTGALGTRVLCKLLRHTLKLHYNIPHLSRGALSTPLDNLSRGVWIAIKSRRRGLNDLRGGISSSAARRNREPGYRETFGNLRTLRVHETLLDG